MKVALALEGLKSHDIGVMILGSSCEFAVKRICTSLEQRWLFAGLIKTEGYKGQLSVVCRMYNLLTCYRPGWVRALSVNLKPSFHSRNYGRGHFWLDYFNHFYRPFMIYIYMYIYIIVLSAKCKQILTVQRFCSFAFLMSIFEFCLIVNHTVVIAKCKQILNSFAFLISWWLPGNKMRMCRCSMYVFLCYGIDKRFSLVSNPFSRLIVVNVYHCSCLNCDTIKHPYNPTIHMQYTDCVNDDKWCSIPAGY